VVEERRQGLSFFKPMKLGFKTPGLKVVYPAFLYDAKGY
jgi:pyruvate/2-oxoglutarate/acetoin dehydrogenase E1 component